MSIIGFIKRQGGWPMAYQSDKAGK